MKEFEWKVTSEYPVRYEARKLFPACVELEESQHANPMRFEVGYYSHEIQNNDYPHLTDGLYGEIVTRRSEKKSRHVIGYRVEVSAYLPNALRLQRHWTETAETFSQARKQMEVLLRTAYGWMGNMLEQTKGLEHTIRWKRTEQGFELGSIGSRLFLQHIFPNEKEFQEHLLHGSGQMTACPEAYFSRMSEIVRKYKGYCLKSSF